MFERIDRVMIPVPDVQQAAKWYVEEFEYRIARQGGREIDLQVHQGETMLTLLQTEQGQPSQPLLHLHESGHVPCFNFYTHWEDLHREWLVSRQVRITDKMVTPYMNVCEMTDPYGNVIGICHEKSSSLYYTPPEGPVPPMFHRVLAVFLPVRDLAASIEWYCECLGFTLHNHWGQGADLRVGNGETIVTMIVMGEEVCDQALRDLQGRAYYSLQTPRIHEAYRQLVDRGVVADPCRELDGVCRFQVRSPEGLVIQITEEELVRVE
jgi:catechol 2,3-dioxygenase-like lactoylglutathione lyase family enzyme